MFESYQKQNNYKHIENPKKCIHLCTYLIKIKLCMIVFEEAAHGDLPTSLLHTFNVNFNFYIDKAFSVKKKSHR